MEHGAPLSVHTCTRVDVRGTWHTFVRSCNGESVPPISVKLLYGRRVVHVYSSNAIHVLNAGMAIPVLEYRYSVFQYCIDSYTCILQYYLVVPVLHFCMLFHTYNQGAPGNIKNNVFMFFITPCYNCINTYSVVGTDMAIFNYCEYCNTTVRTRVLISVHVYQ